MEAQVSMALALLETNDTLALSYLDDASGHLRTMLAHENALYFGTNAGFATALTSSTDEVRSGFCIHFLHPVLMCTMIFHCSAF